MIPVVSFLCVLTVSLVITRVATVALAHTGLSRESARFQARSAFTGVGFTTNESERLVNHPVRRKILMTLMLFGNAGIVTAISSLILTFASVEERARSVAPRLALLATGLGALTIVACSPWVDRRLSVAIGWALSRFSSLNVRDYDSLLQLSGDYRVTELFVDPHDWLAGRTLADLDLRGEGVNVLGIKRSDGTYDGSPGPGTRVAPADNLILYGQVAALEQLDHRRKGRSGEEEHRRAVDSQRLGEVSARPGLTTPA